MTPRRTAVVPLSLDNKTGNGSPVMEDLIAVQTAILTSSAEVLGSVREFRKGMDQRLDRQFREVNGKISTLSVKVDGVCGQVADIEEARRLSEALAKQAAESANTANSIAVQHSLSANQRIGLLVGAFSAEVAALLGFLNFYAGK